MKFVFAISGRQVVRSGLAFFLQKNIIKFCVKMNLRNSQNDFRDCHLMWMLVWFYKKNFRAYVSKGEFNARIFLKTSSLQTCYVKTGS